jgi:hypothetical protein
MLYYTLIYNYDIVVNLHVKVDGNKTSISSFKSNKTKLYEKQKSNINLEKNHFLSISINI